MPETNGEKSVFTEIANPSIKPIKDETTEKYLDSYYDENFVKKLFA
tara:strand:+ start:416 stop:553 length:138 start_codon:yes stop_codon:yes gene_type:complete